MGWFMRALETRLEPDAIRVKLLEEAWRLAMNFH